MKTKKCPKCKKKKLLLEFYFRNDSNKYRNECKSCIKGNVKKYGETHKNKKTSYVKNNPWIRTRKNISQRCNNPTCKAYKYYGGRGIKCLITSGELKELWLRDKAYLMKKPSIDREDNDGNYIFSNCRYIEQSLNSSKDKEKPILQFDLQGNLIKKWQSIKEASDFYIFNHSCLAMCCRNERKTAYGFVWRLDK